MMSPRARQRQPLQGGVPPGEEAPDAVDAVRVASLASSMQHMTVDAPPLPPSAGGPPEMHHIASGRLSGSLSDSQNLAQPSPFATHSLQSDHASRSSFEGLGGGLLPLPPYVAPLPAHRSSMDSRISSSAHTLPVNALSAHRRSMDSRLSSSAHTLPVAALPAHRHSTDSRLSTSAHTLPVDAHAIVQAAAAAAATEFTRTSGALPVDAHAIAQAAAAAAAAAEFTRSSGALASLRSSLDGARTHGDDALRTAHSAQRTFESAPPVHRHSFDHAGARLPPAGRPAMERSRTASQIFATDHSVNSGSRTTSPIGPLVHVPSMLDNTAAPQMRGTSSITDAMIARPYGSGPSDAAAPSPSHSTSFASLPVT